MAPNPYVPSEHFFSERWETTSPINTALQDHSFYCDLSQIQYMLLTWEGKNPQSWKIYVQGKQEPILVGLSVGQRIFECLKRLKGQV